jgi:hypothetical protein
MEASEKQSTNKTVRYGNILIAIRQPGSAWSGPQITALD